ncbi:MAG: flavin reductase family protein [Oscillospiraceae bacterium]|nr:flavin reductase family protein [Oscillospiraceae bacterium]
MKKSFGTKSWMFPQPVLVVATYNDDGKPNAMTVAWAGQYSKNQVVLSLGDNKTTDNIRRNRAFTVGFATVGTLVSADYVGIVSGNDVPNKVEKSGFTVSKSSIVNAPIINELPLILECRFIKFNEDGNIVGEILNAAVDESVLDNEGNVVPAKLNAIIFDPCNADYYKLGEKVGHAFRDGEKLK